MDKHLGELPGSYSGVLSAITNLQVALVGNSRSKLANLQVKLELHWCQLELAATLTIIFASPCCHACAMHYIGTVIKHIRLAPLPRAQALLLPPTLPRTSNGVVGTLREDR